MAYKKKKHHLLLEDSAMTYKKKRNHLLTEDCFIEILLKLPIKSIIKFKCVSKSWYAILVSSYFINTHMKLNEKKKLLFIGNRGKFLSFNLKDESIVSIWNACSDFRNFVGCCNGIICCCSPDSNKIIMLNPFTRDFKVLPHFTRFHFVETIGFGFDDLNNDYKVILILFKKLQKGYRYEAAIYSLKSNTWKLENTNRSTKTDYLRPSSTSLFFNKRVHWDAHDSKGYPMILSMDISSEVFYEFQYSELILLWIIKGYSSCLYKKQFHVTRGYLSIFLFYMFPDYYEQNIDIWSMKEYGVIESWSKQYTIGPLLSIMPPLPGRKDVMLMRVLSDEVEDEDHLLLQFGTPYNCKLVRWNLVENKEVQNYFHKDFYICMEGLFYSQSLVSIAKNILDYI